MNEDKMMDLLDLATEQYAPPPGKQAVALGRMIGRREGFSWIQAQTNALFEDTFHLFSKLMQTIGTPKKEKQPNMR